MAGLLPLALLAALCEDHNDECAGWAADGECKKNPWMHTNCTRSCGRCSLADVANDLLAQGAYSLRIGRLENPTGKSHKRQYQVLHAAKQCNRTTPCLGFSVPLSAAAADPPFPLSITTVSFGFKPSGAVLNETLGWVTFLKATDAQCPSDDCSASSYVSEQTASFHQRSAELLMLKGQRGARAAIRHIDAGTESGLEREQAHHMRARAYLLLDKPQESERELGALLELSPGMAEIEAMRDAVRSYDAAVAEATRLEKERKWGEALLRYSDAKQALSEHITPARVVSGLCRTHLKARQYAGAAKWCAAAHSANPSSIDTLFKHVDARWANSEEHAALQLLKTALIEHPHSDRVDEVREKAAELEQLLKSRSKVDFYRLLEVPRSASARDIKKAYLALALQWHPDRAPPDEDAKLKHEEMFKRISKAHQILGDRELRSRYDKGEDVDAILFDQAQR